MSEASGKHGGRGQPPGWRGERRIGIAERPDAVRLMRPNDLYPLSSPITIAWTRSMHGRRGCISVAAKNVDSAASQALLSALRPAALQAAFDAYEKGTQQGSREIEALQQARYESRRARRQYDAVDPENRLVSGELEKRWEQALQVETQAEQGLDQARKNAEQLSQQDRMRLVALAENLPYVWSHKAGQSSSRNQSCVAP